MEAKDIVQDCGIPLITEHQADTKIESSTPRQDDSGPKMFGADTNSDPNESNLSNISNLMIAISSNAISSPIEFEDDKPVTIKIKKKESSESLTINSNAKSSPIQSDDDKLDTINMKTENKSLTSDLIAIESNASVPLIPTDAINKEPLLFDQNLINMVQLKADFQKEKIPEPTQPLAAGHDSNLKPAKVHPLMMVELPNQENENSDRTHQDLIQPFASVQISPPVVNKESKSLHVVVNIEPNSNINEEPIPVEKSNKSSSKNVMAVEEDKIEMKEFQSEQQASSEDIERGQNSNNSSEPLSTENPESEALLPNEGQNPGSAQTISESVSNKEMYLTWNLFLNFIKHWDCSTSRFCLLFMFLLFGVGIPTVDIGSDIWTGSQLLQQGDIWWGFLTLFLILMPYFGRMVVAIVTHFNRVFLNWRWMKRPEKWQKFLVPKMSGILWLINNFPLFVPFRNLRGFIGLILMDTSLIENDPVIRDIHNEVTSSGVFEAFLESAPQLILQCSIILRTGNYSNSQLFSIPISFFALSLSSAKLFYLMRLGNFSDPRPTFKMQFLIFPFVAVVNFGFLSNLVMMATSSGYVVMIFATVMVIVIFLFINIVTILFPSRNRTFFRKNKFINKDQNLYVEQRDHLTWTTSFTALISPCTVWSNNFSGKSWIPFYVSFIVSFGHLIGNFITMKNVQDNYIPHENFFFCFSNVTNFNSTIYRFVTDLDSNDSFIGIFKNLDDENSIRVCLSGKIFEIVVITSSISFNFSFLIYWLGNDYNLYRLFKRLCCSFDPIIRPSLLQDLIKNDETEKLKNIIEQHGNIAKKLICIKDPIENCFDIAMDKFDIFEILAEMVDSRDMLNKPCKIGTVEDCIRKKINLYHENGKEKRAKRLEKIIQKANKKNSEKTKVRIWREPPMHKCASTNQFEKLFLLRLIGGRWESKNQDAEDVFEIVSKLNSKIFEGPLSMKKNLILRAKNSKGETLLHIAQNQQNIDLIVKLIESGALVNAEDNNGKTPLHFAAENGKFESIEKLIESHALVNAENKEGQTPLHLAAWNGKFESIEKLIESGAHKNAMDKYGQTPLHLAAWNGKFESIEKLIESRALVNAEDKDRQTPLDLAAENGNFESIEKLIESHALVNAEDKKGQTPLHLAAANGKFESIEKLIESGAHVNYEDKDGQTPLHLGVRNGNFESIEKLIESGAKIIKKNCFEAVRYFLVPIPDPFERAATIKKLVDGYADVNAKDFFGRTLLHDAFKRGDLEIAAKLIEHKADINVKDTFGTTPLNRLAHYGDKMIKILVERQAKIEAKNNDDQNPLHADTLESIVNEKLMQFHDYIDVEDKNGKTRHQLKEEWIEKLVGDIQSRASS